MRIICLQLILSTAGSYTFDQQKMHVKIILLPARGERREGRRGWPGDKGLFSKLRETAAAQVLFAATELCALLEVTGAVMAHKVALTAPAQASTIFKLNPSRTACNCILISNLEFSSKNK